MIDDIEFADTFRRRWLGLRPRARGRRMVFPGRSVHGFGMRESLWAVGLDHEGRVVDVERLDPWRIVVMPSATRILELPVDDEPPSQGEILQLTPGQG